MCKKLALPESGNLCPALKVAGVKSSAPILPYLVNILPADVTPKSSPDAIVQVLLVPLGLPPTLVVEVTPVDEIQMPVLSPIL